LGPTLRRGVAPARRGRRAGSGVGLGGHCGLGLDVEFELDLLAYQHAAALGGHVPREAPVISVDLALGGEAGLRAAPRVALDAVELELQGDGPADALDGEVADQCEVIPVLGDAAADVGRAGEVLDVEEVGALEVAIAGLVAAVDRCRGVTRFCSES